MKSIVQYYKSKRIDFVSFSDLLDFIQEASEVMISIDELRYIVALLDSKSKVLIHGEKIFRV